MKPMSLLRPLVFATVAGLPAPLFAADVINQTTDCYLAHPDGGSNFTGDATENSICQLWGLAFCRAARDRDGGQPEWSSSSELSRWLSEYRPNDRFGSRVKHYSRDFTRVVASYVYQHPEHNADVSYFIGTRLCQAQYFKIPAEVVERGLNRCIAAEPKDDPGFDGLRNCLYDTKKGAATAGPVTVLPQSSPAPPQPQATPTKP